jgi:type I restriction enzyme S subunit
MNGGTPKTSVSDYWGGDIFWYAVTDSPNSTDIFVIDTAKKITQIGLENSTTRLLPTGTTIISARGTVGKCALTAFPIAMNQTCYGIKVKKGEETIGLISSSLMQF